MEVIKSADYVIDLGPEGGEGGGKVVGCGAPEELIQVADSYTGQFLRKKLNLKKVIPLCALRASNESHPWGMSGR